MRGLQEGGEENTTDPGPIFYHPFFWTVQKLWLISTFRDVAIARDEVRGAAVSVGPLRFFVSFICLLFPLPCCGSRSSLLVSSIPF